MPRRVPPPKAPEPAPRRAGAAAADRPRTRGDALAVLKVLALAGADHTPIVLTSRALGERIGVSQQAADRYLVALEAQGLLTRSLAQRRQRLALTPAAMTLLRAEFQAYRRIFEGPARLAFAGTVTSGLGEGRYYLSQPGYVVQFSERLGYSPYPGTLNVRVGPPALRKVEVVGGWTGLRIDGFEASGRTFGGASCFPARMNGHLCHLIHPDRSHYQDVVEFIAPERLRDVLALKDDDPVEIELEEP
jgi:riboflavin kinase, archaea type